MNYAPAAMSSPAPVNEVHCEGCGVVLMRFPAGRFMRESDQRARPVTIICADCGTKNSWSGAA
ncbi:hypothetical protein [Candidatus Raskinella chloraquaticus]|uniref:Uncharacterized protein n=1 Tax=Candidatus Raskinella chloraquaticus TaxID=1951219 RepID=A0A1W9HQJ0_9HYPH|nr:MAG: hypothetical protein A4S15_01945 [Proteobacteria bacterium SG_bin8]